MVYETRGLTLTDGGLGLVASGSGLGLSRYQSTAKHFPPAEVLTEELSNVLASNVHCILLFASPFNRP